MINYDLIPILTLYIQIALLIIQIPTLIALIAYVIKTSEMALSSKKSVEVAEKALIEMIEQRDAEIAPNIIAYLDEQGVISGILYLVIKNTGKTAAKNVIINFNPPLQPRYPDLLLKVLPKEGIPTIPPNYEIKTNIDSFIRYKEKGPMQYDVTITYQGGINNKIREDKYQLDLELFRGIVSTVRNDPINDTAKAVSDLNSSTDYIIQELRNISLSIQKNKKTKRVGCVRF